VFVGSFVCRVKPDKRSEFCASVGDLIDRVRWQQGCVNCRLAVDVEMPGTYSVQSEWMNRASLDRFLQSGEYRVFKGMRVLMQDEPRFAIEEVLRRSTPPFSPADRRPRGSPRREG
jgi:quinol monooxygenase YgiN